MKKFFVSVFAALISMSAFAAPGAIKGTNQNNQQEVVGIAPIAAVKYEGGSVKYLAQGSFTEYSLTDANASQYNKVVQSFGLNAAPSAANGWTYDLSKVKVSCQGGHTTNITIPQGPTVSLSDSCQFWQQANGT